MSKKIIIGYLTDWSFYKGYTSKTIDYEKYDIINYSFFSMKNTGELVAPSAPLESQGRMLFGSIDWRERRSNLKMMKDEHGEWDQYDFYPCEGVFQGALENDCKVLASIGGWSHSKEFRTIAKSKKARKVFVSECVKLCRNYGFDGIDLDWEFPRPADRNNFTKLVKELREGLDEYFDSHRMVTSCFGVSENDMFTVYNIKELNKYIDLFNLMTYDQCVGVDEIVTHNSALVSYSAIEDEVKSVKSFVDSFVSLGCPKDKMTIGVGFYGRSFNDAEHVGDPYTTQGPEYSYREIREFKENGAVERFDNQARTNYTIYNKQFITYDGSESIKYKGMYVNHTGLAGAIVWSMDGFSTYKSQAEIEETETNYLLNELRAELDKETSKG